MLPRNAYVRVNKWQPTGLKVFRRYSDQSLVKPKPIESSIKVKKKPNRPPFMKNVFLGIFDLEMLAYPELSKSGLEELKVKVEPFKQYFEKRIDPTALSSLKAIPQEVIGNLKNLGLFGQIIPSQYNGREQTATETACISELIANDLDIALILYSHNFLGVQSLLMFGNQQQKEKYLPRLASGEWIAGFCMSESISGSDIGSLTTKLDPVNDNPDLFFLNGSKQWVINATNTDLFVVLAQVDFRTHVGKTVPVVRIVLVEKDSPGITVSKPLEHLGLKASNICEVHFKDTPVHTESFIGDLYHGFEMCSQILNNGRFNIGAITLSVLRQLMHETAEFILSRRHVDKSLKEYELVQQKFAEIAKCVYTLESMTYHTASIIDQYESPDCALELAIIKVFSFTEGRRNLDMIMDLMGGRAFLNSEIYQKYFRDFRTMEVFDGTVDIANLFISLLGVQHAGHTMNDTVSKMRYPYQYPGYVIKRALSFRKHANDDPKLTLKLYEHLHPSLKTSADELEYCVLRLNYALNIMFNRYAADIANEQIKLRVLADTAVKIYAMTAVLGRASRSYCIGLRNAEVELKYAVQICSEYKRTVQIQINDIIDEVPLTGEIYSLKFGKKILNNHGYFVEHPLERSF